MHHIVDGVSATAPNTNHLDPRSRLVVSVLDHAHLHVVAQELSICTVEHQKLTSKRQITTWDTSRKNVSSQTKTPLPGVFVLRAIELINNYVITTSTTMHSA